MAVRQSPLLTHRLSPSRVPAAPFLQNVGSLRVWAWTPSHQQVRVEHGSCPAGGGTTQLPVQVSTTVAEVKRKLAAVVGLPPGQQVLVAHDPSKGVDLAERELICPEEATLEELGITPAWWLEVRPGPLEESMPLSVVLPSGKYHSMHAAPSMKVPPEAPAHAHHRPATTRHPTQAAQRASAEGPRSAQQAPAAGGDCACHCSQKLVELPGGHAEPCRHSDAQAPASHVRRSEARRTTVGGGRPPRRFL